MDDQVELATLEETGPLVGTASKRQFAAFDQDRFDVEAAARGYERRPKRCCEAETGLCSPFGVLGIVFGSLGVFAALLVTLVLTVNAWAVDAIDVIGTQSLGVAVRVGAVDIALLSARSSFAELTIGSPPGLGSDFLTLQGGVFDLKMSSVFSSDHLELQEITLRHLQVSIDQQANGDSNAKRIIDHVNAVTRRGKTDAQVSAETMTTMTKKITVDKLTFHNISTKLCLHPLCDVAKPGYFWIKQVQVSNVGKKTGGVYLWELLEIIVHALLVAAVQNAPSQLGGNLAGSLGSALLKSLDYDQIHYDVGNGLQLAGVWTGWQLGRLGNSTEWFGNMLAGQMEHEVPDVSNALDQAFGVQHPTDKFGKAVKQTLDSETEVITDTLAQVVENTTNELSEGVDEFAHNMSLAFGGLGSAFDGLFAGAESALRDAGAEQN